MGLFIALLIVPIIEIVLFIQIGGLIGVWPTIAIVIATALIGTAMLRQQGMVAMSELRNRLAAGDDPSGTLAEGAMILIAGMLLLTPGFFTDTLGFCLLIPPVRKAIIRSIQNNMHVVHTGPGGSARPGHPEDQVIDGVYENVSEPGQTRKDTQKDPQKDSLSKLH